MIQNPSRAADLRRDWAAVHKLSYNPGRQYLAAGFGFINEQPRDEFWNLPFILAYAVLDDVLSELMTQGAFLCRGKRPLLGEKMKDSMTKIPWQNYDLVFEGKEKRNELAHKAVLVAKTDCLTFIQAIEAELVAWKIV